ncbi:FhaA domain-containing protein [Aeromicrobium halocynthiae]
MSPTALVSSLLGLLVTAAVIAIALRVAQGIFGTSGPRATATEAAAKLVTLPTGSSGVLRRRFVRALVGQHVVMPSGERLALSELTVRVAPEDLERLDPDGDLDRLGEDAARLYRTHAEREGWALPEEVTVTVEVDPALRSGWVPPARGTRRREPVGLLGTPSSAPHRSAPTSADLDWDRVSGRAGTTAPTSTAGPSSPARQQPMLAVVDDRPTVSVLPDFLHGPARDTGTVALGPDGSTRRPTSIRPQVPPLRLCSGGTTVTLDGRSEVVLGRHAESPLALEHGEVSSRHAALCWRAGRWQVRDLDSTNGTNLDGVAVAAREWTTVRPGSVLELAGVRVDVLDDGPRTECRDDLRAS